MIISQCPRNDFQTPQVVLSRSPKKANSHTSTYTWRLVSTEIEGVADEKGYTAGSLKAPYEKCQGADPLNLYVICVGCEEVGAARENLSQ